MSFNFLLYESNLFDTQKAYSYSFTDVSAEADAIVAATRSGGGCVIFLDTSNIVNPFYEFTYRVRSR